MVQPIGISVGRHNLAKPAGTKPPLNAEIRIDTHRLAVDQVISGARVALARTQICRAPYLTSVSWKWPRNTGGLLRLDQSQGLGLTSRPDVNHLARHGMAGISV